MKENPGGNFYLIALKIVAAAPRPLEVMDPQRDE